MHYRVGCQTSAVVTFLAHPALAVTVPILLAAAAFLTYYAYLLSLFLEVLLAGLLVWKSL